MIMPLVIMLLGIGFILWYQQQKVRVLKEELTSLKEVQEVLITKASLKSREEERQRLARDWHDSMGNVLSTARLLTDNLQTNNKAHLKEVQLLLEDSHELSKSIVKDLRTQQILTIPDLLTYLETLKNRLSLGQITLEYTVNTSEKFMELSPEEKWHFYNLLQELLSNIIQHACASHIQLQLNKRQNGLQLVVADNGQGCQLPQDILPTSIKERVTLLNGHLSIQPIVPNGTKVIVNLD